MVTRAADAFYLGTLADLDRTQSNFTPESSGAMIGTVYGSSRNPPGATIDTMMLNDIHGNGELRENDNGQIPDQMIYRGNAACLRSARVGLN